jgi:hypothetical protein
MKTNAMAADLSYAYHFVSLLFPINPSPPSNNKARAIASNKIMMTRRCCRRRRRMLLLELGRRGVARSNHLCLPEAHHLYSLCDDEANPTTN